MKVTKSRAKGSKQLKFEPNNNTSKQGITSSLLEKYKPNNLNTVKGTSERITKKGVA